jgi:DNA (cytosine-5)-methyltransferase 1
VSAAHIGDETNPHAPQWRDRLYVVATLKGIPLPDVRPRPDAWCFDCEEQVHAVQAWKDSKKRSRKSDLPTGVGKYGQQYVYRCPNVRCRNAVVEPYVLPAAAAIDWSDIGTRIGDRPKPLAAATMRRIDAGLRMFAQPITAAVHGQTWERPGSDYVRAWPTDEAPLNARTGTPGDGVAVPPYMVTVNHDDHGRQFPVDAAPLPPRTTKIGDGVVTPPLLVPAGGTWNDTPTAADEPMRTRTTRDTEGVVVPPFLVDRRDYNGGDSGRIRSSQEPMGTVTAGGQTVRTVVFPPAFVPMLRANGEATGIDEPLAAMTTARHHGLAIPPGAFLQKHHGGLDYGPIEHMTKDVNEPMPVVVAKPNVSLVIPFRRGNRPRTTGEPLHTVSTHDSAAVVAPAIDVDDCYFRMLQPREHLRAQRFPDAYIVTGNKSEQTMQAGNAVPSNVAQWIATRVIAALDGRAAA